jgi:DNA-binding MarR family transcriptional regulator
MRPQAILEVILCCRGAFFVPCCAIAPVLGAKSHENQNERAMTDRRLIFLLKVAQRRVQRFMTARAPKGTVTPTQTGLLFVLGRRDGVLMSEAGAALDLGMPGISGLADRMVEAGLITKRADPDDGRAWRLWLTPAGRKALARTKAGVAQVNARLTEGFTDAEIEIVSRWLTSVQTKFPIGDEE